MKLRIGLLALVLGTLALPARADVNVCITLSATGPAASLGIPEQNTIAFLPTIVDGTKIKYTVYDDATDPTATTRNVRKCVTDDKADILIGSSTAPTSAAAASIAKETRTPIIALAPVTVPADVEVWTFRSVQQNRQMASAILAHMKANGVKSLGFIGYSDAYGEDWIKTIEPMLKDAGIKFEPVERFARTDTSVTGQVLKLMAVSPDAILIVGSGTPSALPAIALAERGYKGKVYQTHGSATRDFIRVGGKAVEGTFMPVGPVVVADQLPDSHPSKAIGMQYARDYEAKHGPKSISAFGGMMFDAGQLIATAIPIAKKKAAPGTAEFRQALRDALEGLKNVVSVNGVYNLSEQDHYGHDARSRVLVTVKDGDFRYVSAD
ncbi:MAG: ABC transporter substrate-binding protein [Hyphomicrobiaceae bacterium]